MVKHPFAKLFYNGLAYPLLSLFAGLGALFSSKLRTGLRGRVGLADRARAFRAAHADAKLVLFHCASAGELEGTKPLAAACRARGWTCAVSYFSPSAISALKSGEFDFADYSPRDSVRSARDYLSALRPDVIWISKHDVWPNLVWQARALGIPVWLINGNFHAQSKKRFPLLRQFNQAIHSELEGILTVSEDDAQRARQVAGASVRIFAVGDSRFDRVYARAQQAPGPPSDVVASVGGRKVVLGGSTHARDEELLLPAFAELKTTVSDVCLLVVPHDPSEGAVARITGAAELCGLSVGEPGLAKTYDVIIVNRSGVLADLYRSASVAYVGGGFDRGVHSVIEPMAHGCEVMCGPGISVSREANEARELALLDVVTGREELVQALMKRHTNRRRSDVLQFVSTRAGVVDRILNLALPEHGTA